MSFLAPSAASSGSGAATPALPKVEQASSLPPVLAPQGSKPRPKSQRPTFMGAAGGDGTGAIQSTTASGNMGGKTLLGQ